MSRSQTRTSEAEPGGTGLLYEFVVSDICYGDRGNPNSQPLEVLEHKILLVTLPISGSGQYSLATCDLSKSEAFPASGKKIQRSQVTGREREKITLAR